MKKFLSIILLLTVSTIFIDSLLGIAVMKEGNMMKGCLISKLGGNSECFFNTKKGLTATIDHINSVVSSMLGIIDLDSYSSILFLSVLSFFFAIWQFSKKLLELIFKENNYFQFIFHNNPAYFSFANKILLNWIKLKTRGQIPSAVPIRAYYNS